MQTNHSPTIDQVPRAVTTAVAAKALNRKPQTLRTWACTGTGPIAPVRINGRLAWPVDAIATLLKGGA
jgi:hypothetical protein